jgi:acylphosphatase
MQPVCLHGFISGRVQGVWFRGFVRNQARQQQLSGWAKNLDDGRVEVLLYGPPENVDIVIKNLHRGSPMARVDLVDIQMTDTYEPPAGFNIL